MANMRYSRPDHRERRWFVRVEFKAADCWIGVFGKRLFSMGYEANPKFSKARGKREFLAEQTHLDIWVCIVPMIPLLFGWQRWGGRP